MSLFGRPIKGTIVRSIRTLASELRLHIVELERQLGTTSAHVAAFLDPANSKLVALSSRTTFSVLYYNTNVHPRREYCSKMDIKFVIAEELKAAGAARSQHNGGNWSALGVLA